MKRKEDSVLSSIIDKTKRIGEAHWLARVLPLLFLAVLVLYFSIATGGRFTNPTSLKIILDQALIVGTISTGAAFIFASGNVNLAMGATTVLTATLAGKVYVATQSIPLMFITALVLGVVIMWISVKISTMFKVRIVFVTIVMMSLLAALQQSILGGSTVSVPFNVIGFLNGFYFSYIAFIVYFVICAILFHMTDIGRSLKMLGTNEVGAYQTGIVKSKYLTTAFVIAGVGCGIGAILAIIRSGSIGQNTLTSLNMDCMLALVLGGMSVFGGSKSFIYAGIVGSITVIVLNQGLLMVGVDSSIIQGVRGIMFLILVYTAQKRPQGLPAAEG